MTSDALGEAYLWKAQRRLRVLDVLMDERSYSDVVREAQEIVELALKGLLRLVGVEPPKFHDVGPILVEHRSRLPAEVDVHLDKLAEISRRLRKEREFAFYGDVDFIPTEQYSEQDARQAASNARFVLEVIQAARPALVARPEPRTGPTAGGREAAPEPKAPGDTP